MAQKRHLLNLNKLQNKSQKIVLIKGNKAQNCGSTTEEYLVVENMLEKKKRCIY